jgi:hypothetical protein
MTEFDITEVPRDDDSEDFRLPGYSQKGRYLIEVVDINPERSATSYRFVIEESSYDPDSAAFWINEGVGIEFWADGHLDETHIPSPGWYVIYGIHGAYIKGEWGHTDDEEEWDFDGVRPATPEEIEGQCLFGPRDPEAVS